MAAKCNILTPILEKLLQTQWGVKRKYVDDIILENYAEYLNCDCIDLEICHPSDCVNEPIVVNCALSVVKISYEIVQNQIKFFIADSDIVNGKAPFTYLWSYEQKDFDPSSAINLKEATLTVKPNKDPNLLVTKLSVTISDSEGCKVTKSCYLTQHGMECGTNYIPCFPPTLLEVVNKNIYCPAPTTLVVIKKQ